MAEPGKPKGGKRSGRGAAAAKGAAPAAARARQKPPPKQPGAGEAAAEAQRKRAANGADDPARHGARPLESVDVPEDVRARAARVSGSIEATRLAILEGRPSQDSRSRRAFFAAREAEKADLERLRSRGDPAALEASFERIIGENEILLLGFLAAGLHAARAVGRIRIIGGLMGGGTGFLVSPTMIMTNNHVLPDETTAGRSCIEFEEFDAFGTHASTSVCQFDPGRLFFTDKELDVSVVALEDSQQVVADTVGLGWHPMVGQEGKIRIGDPVNIIQHPGGRTKSIVLHNSHLMHLENDTALSPFCWYSSDTERGSSGSPVFNNRWEVIAVHHRSVPKENDRGQILDLDLKPMTHEEYLADPERAFYWTNEGTRTSRIVKAIGAWVPARSRMANERDDLLNLWGNARLRNIGQEAAREGARASLRGAAARPGLEAGGGPLRVSGGNGAINIHLHLTGA